MGTLAVRRLSYALGAEIRGVDLSQPIDPATAAEIRKVWLDHLVVVLPDQDIGPEHLLAFTECFGSVDDNQRAPYYRYPGFDKVLLLTNQPVEGKKWNGFRNGQDWHSDLSHTAHPATGSFLLCKQCPAVGGDTMFANMYAAYESLSPAMQRIVESLEGIHDLRHSKGAEQRDPETLAAVMRINPPIAHPAVRVHPETGRKALFVNQRTRGFEGMTEEESRPLLDFLNEHATRYENVYRHRWTPGDVVIWDNRCLVHIALGDFDMWNEPRRMVRCSLEGPKMGRPATV